MNRILTPIIFCIAALSVKGQTQSPLPVPQPFGKVDSADLKMTFCDFEKDANAMVLFDKSEVITDYAYTTVARHKRIKIFNDKGKDVADVAIEFYTRDNLEKITDIEAQTVNLETNIIKYSKVDPSLIYTQVIDKTRKKVTFSFPQVRAGSVIEYSYNLKITFGGGFPDWDFQGDIPVKYCELKASIRNDFQYRIIPRVYEDYKIRSREPWIKDNDSIGNKFVWALGNINSYHDEPFSTGEADNLQRIEFILTAMKFTWSGPMRPLDKSWSVISSELLFDDDFGRELKEKLQNESLIAQSKLLDSDKEKIHFIFNYIKSAMKWNGKNAWYAQDGVRTAWTKKIGNSTEINLALYYFLKKAGVKCYPEFVSTNEHGKVIENHPDMNQFNKVVVSISPGNTGYILDASNKYNSYSDIPFDILNTTGLILNPDDKRYALSFIKGSSSRKVVFVNGRIKSGGQLEGTLQINNFNYDRSNSLKQFDLLGDSKYMELLKNGDNNLKLNSFKRENVEIDTLPLTETADFTMELTGSDANYIYFTPNLFTTFHDNPFISEKRNANIDFGCLNNYVIDGRYSVPPGYNIESLPRGISLVMPDKSISFKRMVALQDGDIVVHYVIDFKRSVFTPDEYKALHDFYKKMYELLEEQIVLKKG
jgi:hypothetical protein